MEKSIKTTHNYDDIIELPHHVSTVHPHMAISNRAAQFLPFSALTGYDAAIKETSRLTNQEIELDENRIEALNEALMILAQRISENPFITITAFVPDEKKDGGSYVSISGRIKKIDEFRKQIILSNGSEIQIDHIIGLEGKIFHCTI